MKPRLPIPRRLLGGPRLPLSLAGGFMLIGAFDMVVLRLLIPEIQKSLHLGLGSVALIATVPPMVFSALAPLVGYLADRTSRVRMQGGSALAAAGSIVAAGVAPTAGIFLTARLAGAGSATVRDPVGLSMLPDYYPPSSRGRVFSFLGFTAAFGATAAPLIAGAVASTLGWRGTLIGVGAVALVTSALVFRQFEPVRGMQDRLAAGIDHELARLEQPPLGWKESWRAVWHIRTLRRYSFSQIFITASLGVSSVLLVVNYAERFHLDPAHRGMVVTLAYSPALVGCLFAGRITDRLALIDPGRVCLFTAVTLVYTALVTGAVVAAPTLPFAVLLHGSISFIAAFLFPAMTTTTSMVLPARVRAFGLQAMAPLNLATAGLTAALTAYVDSRGTVAGVWATVPITLIGAGILLTGRKDVAQDVRAAQHANHHDSHRLDQPDVIVDLATTAPKEGSTCEH